MPALAAGTAAVAAVGLYLYVSTATRALPGCDDDPIRRDVATLISASAPKGALSLRADDLESEPFEEIDAARFEGTIYKRTCATTVRLEEGRIEIRFEIVKDAESAGYFVRLSEV